MDAGGKALPTDEAPPEPVDLTGATYGVAGDEYGALRLQDPSRELKVGDQVQILPGHCDTTVNLHNVVLRRAQGHRRTRLADRGTRAHGLIRGLVVSGFSRTNGRSA